MRPSQIWDLWQIIKQALGLVKQAERIVESKPGNVVPIKSAKPCDETDPDDKFHLNQ